MVHPYAARVPTCAPRAQFHADGHFHSPNYPGHFLWTLDENKVSVNWGKYGSYGDRAKARMLPRAPRRARDLLTAARRFRALFSRADFDLDVESRAMSGHVRGNPDSWRKLEYVEALPAYIKKEHSCGHAH